MRPNNIEEEVVWAMPDRIYEQYVGWISTGTREPERVITTAWDPPIEGVLPYAGTEGLRDRPAIVRVPLGEFIDRPA